MTVRTASAAYVRGIARAGDRHVDVAEVREREVVVVHQRPERDPHCDVHRARRPVDIACRSGDGVARLGRTARPLEDRGATALITRDADAAAPGGSATRSH
ncbi:hypothetical protein [Streptomyces sp. NBC_01506]|uniref:hypothetical protein n=1 Tax=Streptomyces sp. NBC_01506 TaxID=2903887 RepID=UPI003870643D